MSSISKAWRNVSVADVPAGGELHLLVLQVEARLGEAVPVADMVVVQVGDDDVLDFLGVDAEMLEQVGGIGLDLAAALLADGGVEAGVDHDRLAADRAVAALVERDRHPDEIVHREVGVVRVRGDLHFPSLARQMGVFDSMHLVDGRRTHLCFLPVGARCRRVACRATSGAIVPTWPAWTSSTGELAPRFALQTGSVAVRPSFEESFHVRRARSQA